jgi:sulfate transport system substrate-binding protein
MVTFEKGVGDAAITYENEVLVAQKEGQSMDYVVPSSTILIENPIAVVDSYAEKHGNQAIAQAFVDFCLGPDAQRALMEYGLRSIDPSIPSNLPVPPDLFTIQDLGGWAKVKAEIFAKDAAYDQALAAKK